MEFVNYSVIGFFIYFIIKRMLPVKGVRQISILELKTELINKNKQFIDVRTPGEFKGNHIKGFINIPLQQLTSKTSNLSKDKEVIVICQSGMRSQTASKLLKKLGFTKVSNVKGGMSSWS